MKELIRQKLQARRKELGYTQKSFSEKLETSLKHYQSIEQGQRNPSSELAARIIEELKLNRKAHMEIIMEILLKRGELINGLCGNEQDGKGAEEEGRS